MVTLLTCFKDCPATNWYTIAMDLITVTFSSSYNALTVLTLITFLLHDPSDFFTVLHKNEMPYSAIATDTL